MKTIDSNDLANVTGGMNWQNLPRSKNIEDRRTPAGKQRDNNWWNATHPSGQGG